MSDETRLDIAQINSDVLASQIEPPSTVGALEAALLSLFPAQDAEEWDRTGLLVGNPADPIKGVAVALDATLQAIEISRDMGANVLLTHHPAFLDPPTSFKPLASDRIGSGAVVWQAIQSGICLINLHTALDVSRQAQLVLPSMLNLQFERVLKPLQNDSQKGYGQVCSVSDGEMGMSLATFAARCISVFGRIPRVYGNPSMSLNRIVTCTGSASDLPELCVSAGIDCLVCGEIRYHTAIDALSAGLAIVELGHDTSELPLCALLAQSLGKAGVPDDAIRIIDQGRNWWTPEAVRR